MVNKNPKILIIGDIILDKYSYWEITRLNPESSAPLLNILNEEYLLWWAANAARNIANLSWSCDLYWIIGNDFNWRLLQELFKKNHIKFIWRALKWVDTILKQRFIDIGYDHQILRADYEKKIQNLHLKDSQIEVDFDDYEYIIISDYAKGTITEDIMSLVYSSWKPVFFDGKSTNLNLFKGAFLVKPNFREFCNLIGKNIQNIDSEVWEYWLTLAQRLDTNLLITRGSKGASLITKSHEIHHIPTIAKEIYDVTGAWDTFIATVCYGISIWMNLIDAIKLWNKGSAIVIWKIGTQAITKNELF